MNSLTKVLIVDDSATMRGLLRSVLGKDPKIQIVGEAGDAMQARSAIKALNPDVVTLDIEMPNMNGLEFLEKIMTLRPMPVIMVSTLTQRGARASLAALEIGAFDCVGKPKVTDAEPFAGLAELVKAAGRSKRHKSGANQQVSSASQSEHTDYIPARKIISIGSSTGGVEALIQVITKLPKNCPPTVITQHMPPTFTGSFANRLNRLSAPLVTEAKHGDRLEVGHVYVAPGGDMQMQIINQAAPQISLFEGGLVSGHCPSVDVLFKSTAKIAGKRAIGVILTGMGRDGADGLLEMRHAGATTIGQDEQSCVVYGMPKVAYEIGAVEKQLPLNSIGDELIKMTTVRRDRVA